MSRRRAAVKRECLPDAKFGDTILAKFMNCLMYQGKKSVAEAIVYGALDRIQIKATVLQDFGEADRRERNARSLQFRARQLR